MTESYNYHDADIAGWGWTGKEWDPMGRLRAVTTKIWPKHFCEDVIEDAPAIFQRDVKHFQTCTFVYICYVQFIYYHLYTSVHQIQSNILFQFTGRMVSNEKHLSCDSQFDRSE